MSKELDRVTAEAANQNRGFAQSLEALTDLELESRNSRSIERRFRLSRLHMRYSIDSFQFKHHKTRMEAKNRILRLLDLDFLQNGTNVVIIGNPGVGKTFLAKAIGWRACQAHHRVLFTTAMDMLNHLNASQVDHSLVRKLRVLIVSNAAPIQKWLDAVRDSRARIGAPSVGSVPDQWRVW